MKEVRIAFALYCVSLLCVYSVPRTVSCLLAFNAMIKGWAYPQHQSRIRKKRSKLWFPLPF